MGSRSKAGGASWTLVIASLAAAFAVSCEPDRRCSGEFLLRCHDDVLEECWEDYDTYEWHLKHDCGSLGARCELHVPGGYSFYQGACVRPDLTCDGSQVGFCAGSVLGHCAEGRAIARAWYGSRTHWSNVCARFQASPRQRSARSARS